MSYLAIARKYRPVTFDEIVGQEHVTRTLQNAIRRDRVHHGFLFTGARGVGKTTAARALARALNCEQGPTPEPCGTCTSCLEIAQGMHPDLMEIDGASNNSVDDIRELRDTVRYAPTRGRYKVYLVDEVHMLSKGAFNALLKTLEEPPPHVVFVFATTEPNRIPDTILSRVQRFDFKRISGVNVVGRLREIATAEGVTITDHGLRLIARAGEGSMRDSQSLLDQVISYGGNDITDEQVGETLGLVDRQLLYDMLEGIVSGNAEGCLAAIDQVDRFGAELAEFTGELLELVRDAAFVRLSPGARRFLDQPEDEITRMEAATEGVPAEALQRTFHALLDVHDQVSRSSRPRIVLEMAVARLASQRSLQPVGALLGRLEMLEQKLRQGGAAPPRGGSRGGRPRSDRRDGPGGSRRAHSAGAGTIVKTSAPESSRRSGPGADGPWAHGNDGPSAQAPVPAHTARPQARPADTGNRDWQADTGPGQPRPSRADDRYDSLAASSHRGDDEHAHQAPVLLDTPEQRFAAFSEILTGTRAEVLSRGLPDETPGRELALTFLKARHVSEARRALKHPKVQEAIDRCYGRAVQIRIIDRATTGNVSSDLLRHAMSDAAVRRIVDRLKARPETARKLTEDE